MGGPPWRPLAGAVTVLLGLAGLLLGLVGPAGTAGAQDSRVVQMWPDRRMGVLSGRLEPSVAQDSTQVFPLGVTQTSEGDLVRARTYLHFPLGVFPPGTDVVQAILYVYLDSSSGMGQATWGVYRVLEPWVEADRSADPQAWPRLLATPIAIRPVRFDALLPSLSISTVAPTATPTPAPESSAPFSRPAGHGLLDLLLWQSPLSTPLYSPLSTPTRTSGGTPTGTPVPTATPAPTSTLTPTPSTSPLPTSTPSAPLTAPVVTLKRVAGTWLTWDVTALMRAWMAGRVPDDGLALAPAPEPDAAPDEAGDLLAARLFTADDPATRPYMIVHFEVLPVTPIPILPPAGSHQAWPKAGWVLIGAALVVLGLILGRR